jgi:hypothetical protein
LIRKYYIKGVGREYGGRGVGREYGGSEWWIMGEMGKKNNPTFHILNTILCHFCYIIVI